ncbi:MAG: helix-turn-helix domain-containing protein [Caldilinea sp.]|nr:helix-turn-helix domain-containing protein [Caldilinea sp.]MDW8442426.1 helix-turn-helix domain-containing protein [Caldilineaceae bacterium]
MHAVRKHILEILKETGGATVAELAERLDMAPVSVRHHLDILQGDNLIRVGRLERTGGVGRPQQIYQLTDDAIELFPKNFAILAAGMVRQLKQRLPPEQVDAIFKSLAAEMAAEAHVEDLEALPLTERLERITAFLNERGYLARWEAADGEGEVYMLYKHNCPYAGMSDEHRELCMMDQWLIDRLVGVPCSRTASVVNNDKCCAYQIEAEGEVKRSDATARCQEILLAA